MLQVGLGWCKLDKAMTIAFEGILALGAKCGIEMNVAEPCLPSTMLVLENSEGRIRADTSLLYTTHSCHLIFRFSESGLQFSQSSI